MNETTSKHSPGPWSISADDSMNLPRGFLVRDQTGDWVADVIAPDVPAGVALTEADERGEANARLIAAAPRMYDFIARAASEGDEEAAEILEAVHGKVEGTS